MVDRPLLILPTAETVDPTSPQGWPGGLVKPTRQQQVERIGPVFQRLQEAMPDSEDDTWPLQEDPTGLAPDRVIVFEIAGNVQDFAKAIGKVKGLELLLDQLVEREANESFAMPDDRAQPEGMIRIDKPVRGCFYMAVPDVRALRELLGLWNLWKKKIKLPWGLTPFRDVFAQLRELRTWGVQDRIPRETIECWRAELMRNPDKQVRAEVELWYHKVQSKREAAFKKFKDHVRSVGGTVVNNRDSVIEEIAYHGVLIDIPADAAQRLVDHVEVQEVIDRSEFALAFADEVMFLRPQSVLSIDREQDDYEGLSVESVGELQSNEEPIAALLDGVLLQQHDSLRGRLRIDDPENLEDKVGVSDRQHATAMAHLILHGDRNCNEAALDRPLYTRPIVRAERNDVQTTDSDQLLVDIIYEAVVRIKGSGAHKGEAPAIFLINLSIGDPRRPFTGLISPLARLLDFLADQYGILFLVSAGNIRQPFRINGYENWIEIEQADEVERERAVLESLDAAKFKRSILSPGEALNVLTIGAQHHDEIRPQAPNDMHVDPFQNTGLPNPSSALGLGFRRSIKPELYFPAGRERLRLVSTAGKGVEAGISSPQDMFGVNVAVPGMSEQGQLNRYGLYSGTSSATALATRAAHEIFDALTDREGGGLFADLPSEYYAVVVKALLVHRARWDQDAKELLADICGPPEGYRYPERYENISRFLGLGIPNKHEAVECASNRATLVGYGEVQANKAHKYRVPLPPSLELVKYPRLLTITLAWFSPIMPTLRNYRGVKLDVVAVDRDKALGVVDRVKAQPFDDSVERGTVMHNHYSGKRAVPFIDNGHLTARVTCREDAGCGDRSVRYGLAVTIESEEPIPIYEEIRDRLLVEVVDRNVAL